VSSLQGLTILTNLTNLTILTGVEDLTEKLTFDKLKAFIELEVDEFYLEKLREKHDISGDCSVFYTSISRLVQSKKIKKVGRGVYRKVKQIQPVKVFGRKRRLPIRLEFPHAQDTGMELDFARDIVFREGDLLLLSGQSNKGKTALCMNFCAENIDSFPILMGNEYTTIDDEPLPRFLNRIDNINWIEWADEEGNDRFNLLPVTSDYAEHIVKDRINIIDWINLPGEYYLISPIMEGIKRELGKGIAIIAIQKNPGMGYGRGGHMTKDFADCELLLDQFGDKEILLTVGKVKEYLHSVSGRMFVYKIDKGVKIMNFREVVRCPYCKGIGTTYQKGIGQAQCSECNGRGKIDKGVF